MNRVLEGKYAGKKVIVAGLGISIATGIFIPTVLSKRNIKSFELMNQDDSKSLMGAVARGVVGGAVFGGVGAIAGVVSSRTSYLIRVNWLDGETSLIETDVKGFNALNVIEWCEYVD